MIFRPTALDPYGVAKNIMKFHYATLSLRHNYKEVDEESTGSYDMVAWKSVAATADQLSAAGLPCSGTWLKDEQGNAVSRSMFEYIRDYTGYYIEASAASAQQTNGKLNVSVSLKNYGSAAPLTMSAPQIVFIDDCGNVLSSAPLCDVADLQPGKTVAASATLDLPEDMSNVSLGIRFVNPQGTPAKLANDLEVRHGVNILYDFPITEGRYGAYVVRQMTKNALDAGDIVGRADNPGTIELSAGDDGELRAEFAKNGSTEKTSHQITLTAQTKQIADKQYLYFKVKSLSDRTTFLRLQANDGAHGIWSRADKFEFLGAGAEQWTALGVENYGEYKKYVQLPAHCDGWMRVALSDMHNVNGNGKTAADIVSLENLMLHAKNWGGDSQTLLLNTVYAADANVDISLLANPGAVILRDMGASEADWENANDLTLTLSNGRLNVNVPQNGGERNAEFILPMTNTDTLGKKYVYFSIDKPSTQEDAQKIWLNVFQAVNEKDWWAEVHDKLEINDGSGWKAGSFIGNTVGGRFWFRWRIGEGAAAHFFAKDQITKLQFKFASHTAADFSIGNIYAANADDEVPGLLPKQSGYTATFVNGDKAVAALQGETVTAPDAVAIDGFEFVGWADADDYSKIYKAGSKIKLTEDTTFVAAGVSLETLNSASIRWSADDAKRGLRFTSVVRSNLGGAKETGELVSPALVKTAIKDLGNDTVKEVLNSSPKGGNSRWAEESTVTDLCWHGSVIEFAGRGDEVISQKFSAWAVAEIKYQDGSSGWFTSKATDGVSMKEIAQQIYEQNPYANGASVKDVLKEVYKVG